MCCKHMFLQEVLNVLCSTGVTLAEKWTTDNFLTSQITVEDQVHLVFSTDILWCVHFYDLVARCDSWHISSAY